MTGLYEIETGRIHETILLCWISRLTLGKVVTSHLGLDLHRVEDLTKPLTLSNTLLPRTHLAVVDTNNRPDHLWHDDHVSQVSLDHRGLFIRRSLLLGFTELLDEAHRTALEAALEPAPGAGMDELGII